MFGSASLEVAIGLALVFLLLSLVCTTLNELLAQGLSMRAKMMEEGLARLLGDPARKGLVTEFYAHPLIQSLSQRRGRPSYIPSQTFALVLIDVLGRGKTEVAEVVANAQDPQLRRALQVLLAAAGGDQARFRRDLETWFDDTMDRVSGWYKRWTQKAIVAIAVAVAFVANVDTLLVANVLFRDATLRTALVARAEVFARQPGGRPDSSASPFSPTGVAGPWTDFRELALPVGWDRSQDASWYQVHGVSSFPAEESWITKIAGLLLTACALILGAPFWFDALKRIINIRAVGKPPEREPGPASR